MILAQNVFLAENRSITGVWWPIRQLLLSSHYVVTGPLRWPWVRLSLFEEHSPEPQAEGAGHEREVTIFGFGCPC